MRIFIKFFVLIALLSGIYIDAQIQNGDFEDWNGNTPLFWYTSNNPETAPGSINITRTTDTQNGIYAVRGETVNTAFGVHNPSVHTNDFNNEDILGFPISVNPVALTGYFKYEPVSESEYLSITAWLVNTLGDENIVVGVASRLIANTIFLDSIYTFFKIPFNYYFTEKPNIIYLSIGITSQATGSVFYLDNLSLSYINIIAPEPSDIIIASEKYKIRWTASAENVNIKYSLDDGTTFTSIVDNYPSDSNKYVWDVPKELLSTKAVIRVEDSEDNSKFDERFVMIKPWQLTRLDENGDFELYELYKHAWTFDQSPENIWPMSYWEQFDYEDGNDPYTNEKYMHDVFINANSNDFPDWPVFVKAFGSGQCYIGDYEYDSDAVAVWHGMKNSYYGSCFGLSVTSLLYFYHLDYMNAHFPSIGSPNNLNQLSVNDSIRKIIHQYHTQQVAQPILDYKRYKLNLDARQTLDELKEMLGQNNTDASVLSYFGFNPSGGHAVVPYKLERRDDSAIFDLWVYDSNPSSGSSDKIVFDSTANTWTDNTGINWTGSYLCYLNLPVGAFKERLLLRSEDQNLNLPKVAAAPRTLTIFNNSNADILISGQEGEIEYSNNQLDNSLSNATAIIPITGNPQPPIGYYLPNGVYGIQISNISDTKSYLSILNDSTNYNYRRSSVKNSESDIFNYSDGFEVKNIDPITKKFSIETIIHDDLGEKILIVSEMSITENDSISVKEYDRDKVKIKNYGSEKNYNLQIRRAYQTGSERFNYSNITLEGNSSHYIIPDWENLEEESTLILIDENDDGIIDDSLYIDNQITTLKTNEIDELPTKLSLDQNYPNPFNPSTTIKYSIPSTVKSQKSKVKIVVFDLLGNVVKTLVDKYHSAGEYEIEFNTSADGIQLSSGIYFYRLQVGEFNETKKMILLK